MYLNIHLITPEFGLNFQEVQQEVVVVLKQGRIQGERDLNANEQREIQRISTMHISKDTSARETVAVNPSLGHPVEKDHAKEAPGNWVDADEDDDDADGNELCVQSTPPYYEEQ
ncbi:hypothetical protein OIU76_016856 [Salix suchowensis]|nr:hypothetical protein OIU76_016856 [Salix suchowensis]